MSVNWLEVRDQFPALKDWIFLNTATFGQLSRRTVEAMTKHLAHRDELACADFLDWFTDHDGLRRKLARLINADAADIAYLPNACTGLGILMNGLDWKPGDEVVTLEGEFPDNIYAPAFLAHRGVKLVEARPDKLLESLTAATRLVIVSTVNYSTGYRAPLEEIAPVLRKHRILLYVDATQSLGALRFDFSAIQPDLLAVNCYKWMLAPNGIAFMAVSPRLRDKLDPLSVGWRSHHAWRNVNNLHQGKPVMQRSAEKYEGGMLPSSLIYGLEASVDLMLELGPEAIERRVLELACETRAMLRALGAKPLPYENSAIVAAGFEGLDTADLAKALKARRIQVSTRHGLLRVSTHFYNTEEDVAELYNNLRQLGA